MRNHATYPSTFSHIGTCAWKSRPWKRAKNLDTFQDYFPELVNYMISGEVVAVCLARKEGIERWKAVMGPPDVR